MGGDWAYCTTVILYINSEPFQANPFRDRICQMFAVSATGMMSFVEFLDMVAAFSPEVYRMVVVRRVCVDAYDLTKYAHF